MGIREGLISSSSDRNEASNFWNRRLIEEGEKKNRDTVTKPLRSR